MISDEYGSVKKIDNIAISLQTQIVRLFLSKFLGGECLDKISDILKKNDFNQNEIITNKLNYYDNYNIYNKIKNIINK